jgi:MFS family permease
MVSHQAVWRRTEPDRQALRLMGQGTQARGALGTGAFWLLCVAVLGTYTAQGVLYPGLPLYLTGELGASKAVTGLVTSSMSVAALTARVWAGPFVDRYGRKPLLFLGTSVLALTGVALLHATSVAAVLVIRLAQGAAGALTYSSSAAMAADLAPVEQRARYLARFGSFFYVGFAAGPWLAEFLIGRSGFEAVWWTVVFAALATLAIALALPETGGRAVAGGGAPTTAVPILRRLFHPAAVAPGVLFFCVSVGWSALSAFLALYARDIGLDSSDGLFLALSITVLATRPFAGTLADRMGKPAVLLPSVAFVAVALTTLAAFRSPAWAVAGLVLFGVGFSGLFPVLFAVVVDRAPDNERATAMSSFNVFFDVGAPLGGYGTGLLIDQGGFGLGFGATAALAAVGGVLLVDLVRRGGLRPAPPAAAPLGAVPGRGTPG